MSNLIRFFYCLYPFKEFKWRLLLRKLSVIRLLVLDVDGVLTDGGLWINSEGQTTKRFDVQDGLALKLMQEIGLEIVLLSGAEHGSTKARAKQLGIKYCYVGIKDKYKMLKDLQKQLNIPISKTAYIGDDINDIVVKPLVAIFFAPLNAADTIIPKTDMVLSKKGGRGAIRELAERILIAKKIWNHFSKNGWKKKN